MQHKNRFMLYVFIGLILGLLTGYLCFSYIPSTVEKEKISENFNIISSCFIRLIQMIIAPLIISTLITGLAKNGNMKSTGRIGIKALFIFLITSFMAIAFGLVMVNIFQPGDTLNASILPHSNNITASENILTLKNFVLHIFPKSIVESMANNEILQVV
ncbi:MAG TPA: cation:dicarboxylase symporter family transporter, partial [Burkholderiales bacterium]|nr:cation:dicarboxylase symporter family transporter [Burkholderiales bacterium]